MSFVRYLNHSRLLAQVPPFVLRSRWCVLFCVVVGASRGAAGRAESETVPGARRATVAV